MSMLDRYPSGNAISRSWAFQTVLSPVTDPRISAAGVEMAVAQPCYPVQVAHGHVQALLEAGVDYVLLPNIVDAESGDDRCAAHYCPWNQTLPWVLRSAPALEPRAAPLPDPDPAFPTGPGAGEEGTGRDHAAAGRHAACQRSRRGRGLRARSAHFRRNCWKPGAAPWTLLDQTGEPGLVLAGRGYNIYDRGVNCDIPRKLRHRYGANVIPLDFLVTGREPRRPARNMFWVSGRKILEAARIAAERPNLHMIYITNFKCGPDSYIKHFAREAAGAPLLVLQFDGHGNDAGYMTRCEAYLDSKGILRCYQSTTESPQPGTRQPATTH